MEFPALVNYVIFSNSQLDASGRVDDVRVRDNMFMIRQTIGKESFEYLIRACKSKNDFAFASYKFKINQMQPWDREIKMYKEMINLNVNKEDRKRGIVKVRDRDPFKNLVIKFLRKPDLNKRKKLCGY